jgi:hypothetical protein
MTGSTWPTTVTGGFRFSEKARESPADVKGVMDFANIEFVTLVFLVGMFLAAEVYRFRRGRPGVIVAAEASLIPLPVQQVRVRTAEGEEVTAAVDCCTACLGRLQVGDEVRVSAGRDGHVIHLPWIRGSACRVTQGGRSTHLS